MTDRTISRYRILEKLGAGGMGIVYKAEDPRLKRIIALKVLNELFSSDDDARERLEREAQAAASLNHPNIIGIYEIGDFEGRAYIAMEYVEGQSLDEAIGGKPLPIEQAVEFTIAIADALALTHRTGVVHRDIKPHNIMVSASTFGARPAPRSRCSISVSRSSCAGRAWQ
jgi:serine/threonine protein kinase